MNNILHFEIPTIPHLHIRMFSGATDLAPSVALGNACSKADGLDHVDTLADAEHWITNFDDSCNPYRDLLIAEVNGQMIAKALTGWYNTIAGEWVYWLDCSIHPEWRDKGLGHILLNWQEQHCRKLAAQHKNSGSKRIFQVWADTRLIAKTRLLQQAGYEAMRFRHTMTLSLASPLPTVDLPDGFEVRPTKSEHLRDIFDASSEASQDYQDNKESNDQDKDFQKWQTEPLFQPELFRVAWHIESNEVAGMVLNYIDWNQNKALGHKAGYTEGISVRQPYRNRGLAKSLISMSLHLHKSLGMTEAKLGVDANNPTGALNLYESVGFKVQNSLAVYQKTFESPPDSKN